MMILFPESLQKPYLLLANIHTEAILRKKDICLCIEKNYLEEFSLNFKWKNPSNHPLLFCHLFI